MPCFSIVNPSRSCQGYCLMLQVQFWAGSGWWKHVGIVGLLVMVCCEYISLAISFGFVMMSPFWFKMQSSGWILLFLKSFWWIFFGLLSYSCLYFQMALLVHSL